MFKIVLNVKTEKRHGRDKCIHYIDKENSKLHHIHVLSQLSKGNKIVVAQKMRKYQAFNCIQLNDDNLSSFTLEIMHE